MGNNLNNKEENRKGIGRYYRQLDCLMGENGLEISLMEGKG